MHSLQEQAGSGSGFGRVSVETHTTLRILASCRFPENDPSIICMYIPGTTLNNLHNGMFTTSMMARVLFLEPIGCYRSCKKGQWRLALPEEIVELAISIVKRFRRARIVFAGFSRGAHWASELVALLPHIEGCHWCDGVRALAIAGSGVKSESITCNPQTPPNSRVGLG